MIMLRKRAFIARTCIPKADRGQYTNFGRPARHCTRVDGAHKFGPRNLSCGICPRKRKRSDYGLNSLSRYYVVVQPWLWSFLVTYSPLSKICTRSQSSKYSVDSHHRKADSERLSGIKVNMLSEIHFRPYLGTPSYSRPDLHVAPRCRPSKKGHYHRSIASAPSPRCWIQARYTRRYRTPLNWSWKWQPIQLGAGTLGCLYSTLQKSIRSL